MYAALGMSARATLQPVRAKVGFRRALVACSNAYATLISAGSDQAGPKKEIPAGNPCTRPAGTVTWGYPATAGGVEQPPAALSPLM